MKSQPRAVSVLKALEQGQAIVGRLRAHDKLEILEPDEGRIKILSKSLTVRVSSRVSQLRVVTRIFVRFPVQQIFTFNISISSKNIIE